MMSLLFHFLDEWLFAFSADPFFIPRIVKITEFDKEKFHIKSSGWGEPFDISKHPQVGYTLRFVLNVKVLCIMFSYFD
ncbi:unnamed protein product [Schistosoma bovis]|nr:unnamed protein product [Schistosoma bovis]